MSATRRLALHVRLTDHRARRGASLEEVLGRAQAILAGAGIDLELELGYDLDELADALAAEASPSLTALEGERAGARIVGRAEELELERRRSA